jgi:hypothetical protein
MVSFGSPFKEKNIPNEYALNFYVQSSEHRLARLRRGICLDRVAYEGGRNYTATSMSRRQYSTPNFEFQAASTDPSSAMITYMGHRGFH